MRPVTTPNQFWGHFWDQNLLSHEDITQNLFAFGHVPHDAIVWEPPTVEMLVEISRNSKGGEAASVDGWKADELKHVPPKGLGVCSCSCRDLWEKHGRVPVALQHSRMVNLPKKSNAGIVWYC